MADILYSKGIPEWGNSFASGTIKVLLVDSGYTPNKDHDFVADVTPGTNEIVATNYVRKTLASKTAAVDDANDRYEYDAADVVWTSLGGATNDTIAGAVLYLEVTNDADSVLLAYYDLADTATNGNNVTLQFHTDGLFYEDQGA